MPSKPRAKASLGDFIANPPAAPAPVAAAPKKHPAKKPASAEPAIPEKAPMRALTVRLDVDRWLRLRQHSLHDGRSANQIIVDLLDAYLDPTK